MGGWSRCKFLVVQIYITHAEELDPSRDPISCGSDMLAGKQSRQENPASAFLPYASSTNHLISINIYNIYTLTHVQSSSCHSGLSADLQIYLFFFSFHMSGRRVGGKKGFYIRPWVNKLVYSYTLIYDASLLFILEGGNGTIP